MQQSPATSETDV